MPTTGSSPGKLTFVTVDQGTGRRRLVVAGVVVAVVVVVAAVAVALGVGRSSSNATTVIVPGVVTAIGCSGASSCVGLGANLSTSAEAGNSISLTTTDGGSTWRTSNSVPDAVGAGVVSCWDPLHCMAAGAGGGIGVTADGGSHWQALPVAPTAVAVSCPAAEQCFAVVAGSTGSAGSSGSSGSSVDFDRTADGGMTWSTGPVPGLARATALWCADAEHCLIAGTSEPSSGVRATPVLVGTIDGGQSWGQGRLPAGVDIVHDLTCTSSQRCVGVASPGLFLSTVDGGFTWTATALAASGQTTNGPPSPVAVSCAGPNDCLVVDEGSTDVQVTTDGGATWTPRPLPSPADQNPAAVTCQPAGFCLVTGSQGANSHSAPSFVARSTDGGASWQQVWSG